MHRNIKALADAHHMEKDKCSMSKFAARELRNKKYFAMKHRDNTTMNRNFKLFEVKENSKEVVTK